MKVWTMLSRKAQIEQLGFKQNFLNNIPNIHLQKRCIHYRPHPVIGNFQSFTFQRHPLFSPRINFFEINKYAITGMKNFSNTSTAPSAKDKNEITLEKKFRIYKWAIQDVKKILRDSESLLSQPALLKSNKAKLLSEFLSKIDKLAQEVLRTLDQKNIFTDQQTEITWQEINELLTRQWQWWERLNTADPLEKQKLQLPLWKLRKIFTEAAQLLTEPENSDTTKTASDKMLDTKLELAKQCVNHQLLDELLKQVAAAVKDLEPGCFISYAWGVASDVERVHRLAKDLKKAGIKIHLDIWENTLSTEIRTGYLEQIDKADYVIVMGSPQLLFKAQVRNGYVVDNELQRINYKREHAPESFIPVLLSGEVHKAFPFYFNAEDIVYVTMGNQSAINRNDLFTGKITSFVADKIYCKAVIHILHKIYEKSAYLPDVKKITKAFSKKIDVVDTQYPAEKLLINLDEQLSRHQQKKQKLLKELDEKIQSQLPDTSSRPQSEKPHADPPNKNEKIQNQLPDISSQPQSERPNPDPPNKPETTIINKKILGILGSLFLAASYIFIQLKKKWEEEGKKFFNIPLQTDKFIPTHDYYQLLQALENLTPETNSKQDIRKLAINGIPGIGKTELAKYYAHQKKEELTAFSFNNFLKYRYFHPEKIIEQLLNLGKADQVGLMKELSNSISFKFPVIWRLNVAEREEQIDPKHSSNQFKESFIELAKKLGINVESSQNENDINYLERLNQAVSQALIEHPDSILIFDNAENYENIKPYIPNDIPSAAGLHLNIIVTTHNEHFFQSMQPQSSNLAIKGMNEEEAGMLLKKITGLPLNQDAKKFVKSAGCSPLYVSLSGFYIKQERSENSHYSYSQFLDQLRQEEIIIEEKFKNMVGQHEHYHLTQKAAFRLLIKKVGENADAQNLLIFCGLLDADHIPEKLLALYFNALSTQTFNEIPPANAKIRLDQAIQALRAISLLKIENETSKNDEQKFYYIHRNIQKEVRELQKENRLADIDKASFFRLLSALIKFYGEKNEKGLDEFDRQKMLMLHYEMLIKKLQPYKDLNLEEKIILAASFNQLGTAYYKFKQNLPEAKSYFDQAIVLQESLPSAQRDNGDMLRCLANLVSVYATLRQWKKADQYLKQALEFVNEYGDKDGLKAELLLKLAHLSRDKKEDKQKNLKLYQDALAAAEQEWGKNHIRTVRALMGLGAIYFDMGDLVNAKAYMQKAYDIEIKEIKTPDLTNLRNLGVVNSELNQLDEAKKCLVQARDIAIKTFGPQYPELVQIFYLLSIIYAELHDLKHQRLFLEQAKDLAENNLENPRIAKIYYPEIQQALKKLNTPPSTPPSTIKDNPHQMFHHPKETSEKDKTEDKSVAKNPDEGVKKGPH